MKTTRSVTVKLLSGAIATAMLATSVTPAAAQSYPGGDGRGYGDGYGRGHYAHRNGIGVGEVIAGVAILGVLAAIASSGSKRNRGYQDGYRGGIDSEQDAADACSSSARQQGARVANIDQVDRTRDGYRVRGTLSTRGNDGYGRGYEQGFTCAVRYGAVEAIRVDDYRNGRDDGYDRSYGGRGY